MNLKITKIDEKKNLVYFTLNDVNYTYNIKTEFIYIIKGSNSSYVGNFDRRIKKMIKDTYLSFKKYNKKIEES